jgi:hypothetical protein
MVKSDFWWPQCHLLSLNTITHAQPPYWLLEVVTFHVILNVCVNCLILPVAGTELVPVAYCIWVCRVFILRLTGCRSRILVLAVTREVPVREILAFKIVYCIMPQPRGHWTGWALLGIQQQRGSSIHIDCSIQWQSPRGLYAAHMS